ncbi:hypothetical protein TRIATDRAFT_281596 [Trichoderma atroviride IMI 206040]|uniref:Uncharacterized protein n=1 Tax=Hypocrea atroviridis (strain ATCC 20476 / IMI 206040) TaxID=452589 RepID=G9NLQ8_HYPAI|nr:uncharacterized protein TRIATDRAFT_281596 [Trichoderma atroviride IMI 206040]EHK48818.1 hypothetical protein TRIATDRAFT_281596 [Trichoderma atroviride IMI 206040]
MSSGSGPPLAPLHDPSTPTRPEEKKSHSGDGQIGAASAPNPGPPARLGNAGQQKLRLQMQIMCSQRRQRKAEMGGKRPSCRLSRWSSAACAGKESGGRDWPIGSFVSRTVGQKTKEQIEKMRLSKTVKRNSGQSKSHTFQRVTKIHTQRRAGSETPGVACVLQQKFAGDTKTLSVEDSSRPTNEAYMRACHRTTAATKTRPW